MNSTSNGKFKSGNVVAKRNIGKRHHSTIVKELLSERIETLDGRLFEITLELLNSKNLKIKLSAWREIIRYRIPGKIWTESKIILDKEQLKKDLESFFE